MKTRMWGLPKMYVLGCSVIIMTILKYLSTFETEVNGVKNRNDFFMAYHQDKQHGQLTK